MILRRLDELDADVEKASRRADSQIANIAERIEAIQLSLVELKVKAGLWGAFAGALPGLLAAGIASYFGHKP